MRNASHRRRSAYEPVMMSGVIVANIIWKSACSCQCEPRHVSSRLYDARCVSSRLCDARHVSRRLCELPHVSSRLCEAQGV
ncbi:hypothetical protein T484DRAFT_3604851 [Baffinella frigidus]|nr:hypothetical protein T484DRAFT_3604851 [Cryptophyta sp. CCMP2293]